MDSGTMTLHSGSIIQNSTTEFLPDGNLVVSGGTYEADTALLL